jgi:hypothetical protein
VLLICAVFTPLNVLAAQICNSSIQPNNPTSEFTVHGNGTVTHLQARSAQSAKSLMRRGTLARGKPSFLVLPMH